MSQKVINKPSKQGKPKPKKNVRKVVDRKGNLVLAFRVPDCVEHYFMASVDPCDALPGACLPCDLFPLPSQKVTGFIRGSFNTGTGTFGWICLSPSLANDVTAVSFTGTTSVGTFGTVFNTYTNIQAAQVTNLPYATAAFTAGQVLGRTVAYGIRIRCLDSMMNRGGQITYGEHPEHLDSTGFTYLTWNTSPYTKTHTVSSMVSPSGWDAAVSSSGPVTPNELQYSNNQLGNLGNVSPLLIAVRSPAAGSLYEYEAYIHQEYIGFSIPTKTPSHSDPQTFAKVVTTLKNHTAVAPLSPDDGPSLWKDFKGAVADNLPQIMEFGAGALRMALGDESGGGMQMAGAAGNLAIKTITKGGSDNVGKTHSPFLIDDSMWMPKH